MIPEPVGFRVGERLFCSLYSAGLYASEMKLTIDPLYLGAVNSPETPDGWIACSQVLPRPFVDVIASDGKQVFTAHFIDEANWWCLVSQLADEPGDVTHWIPLPAAPKPEK